MTVRLLQVVIISIVVMSIRRTFSFTQHILKLHVYETWGQFYKTFHSRNVRIYGISQIIRPWQAFHAQSVGLWVRSERTRVKHLPGPALPTNIGIGWKGLPRTNTLALLRKFVNYGHKTFYRIGPWLSCLHTFSKLIGQNWVYFKFFFYASTSYSNILIGMPITYPKWRLDTHYDDTGPNATHPYGHNCDTQDKRHPA